MLIVIYIIDISYLINHNNKTIFDSVFNSLIWAWCGKQQKEIPGRNVCVLDTPRYQVCGLTSLLEWPLTTLLITGQPSKVGKIKRGISDILCIPYRLSYKLFVIVKEVV